MEPNFNLMSVLKVEASHWHLCENVGGLEKVPKEGYPYLFFHEAGNYHVATGIEFHDSSKLHLEFANICVIS